MADKGLDQDLAADLPKLAVGDAHVWSPAWLKVSRVTTIIPRQTFDASSTPQVGRTTRARELAPIDLEALKSRMSDTIEKAKADDPRELRAQIARLERDLATAAQVAPAPAIATEVLTQDDRDNLHSLATDCRVLAQRVLGLETRIGVLVNCHTSVSGKPLGVALPRHDPDFIPQGRPLAVIPVRGGDAKLSRRAERQVLMVLAQYPAGRTTTQCAILAGYAVNGGGFKNAVSALRSRGFIEGGGDRLTITPAGLEAVGAVDTLPTGAALLVHWQRQLKRRAEREVLGELARVYPRAIDAITLALAVGYASDGGGFKNAVSRLRSLELISGRGELRASDALFG
jgi:hypothetical protein